MWLLQIREDADGRTERRCRTGHAGKCTSAQQGVDVANGFPTGVQSWPSKCSIKAPWASPPTAKQSFSSGTPPSQATHRGVQRREAADPRTSHPIPGSREFPELRRRMSRPPHTGSASRRRAPRRMKSCRFDNARRWASLTTDVRSTTRRAVAGSRRHHFPAPHTMYSIHTSADPSWPTSSQGPVSTPSKRSWWSSS